MGRSNLQGEPWHYEYAEGTGKNNSKNCAYNVGHCTFTGSLFHGQECVGKLECEDFERGNAQGPRPKKQKSVKPKRVKQAKKGDNSQGKKQKHSRPQEQQKSIHLKKDEKPSMPKDSIKVGDSIIVQDLDTLEIFNITIVDPKNQFVGKILSQSVEINKVWYKVVQINDKQEDIEL